MRPTPATWSSRSPRCWAGAGAASPRSPWPAARTRRVSTRALDEARRLTAGGVTEPVRPGRAVGVDLGAKRIGIAVSDSAGTLATPRGTIMRSGDTGPRPAGPGRPGGRGGGGGGGHRPPALPRRHPGPAARAAEDEAAALAPLAGPTGRGRPAVRRAPHHRQRPPGPDRRRNQGTEPARRGRPDRGRGDAHGLVGRAAGVGERPDRPRPALVGRRHHGRGRTVGPGRARRRHPLRDRPRRTVTPAAPGPGHARGGVGTRGGSPRWLSSWSA